MGSAREHTQGFTRYPGVPQTCEDAGHAIAGPHRRRSPRLPQRSRTLLECAGYEVVGEAATATAASAAAARLQPDLVILDIGLPDGSGLDATAEIRAAAPATAVVLVSVRPATDYGHAWPSPALSGSSPRPSSRPPPSIA